MFEQPKREMPSVGMTPLIDVVFILLIFVVLAANFDRIRGLKVNLPEASSQHKPQKKSLVVSITAQGHIHIEDKQVELHTLLPTLQRFRKQHEVLLLQGDSQSHLNATVKVLDAATHAGFLSVSIATKRTSLP